MAVTLAFLAVLAIIAGWWLAQQRLVAARPWLEEGELAAAPAPRVSAAGIGLGVLLAVIGSLFALFASAYVMRMHMAADWRPLPEPGLLWFNTGILVLSSLALERARVAVRHGRPEQVRAGLLAGGACALAFLAGQLLAWRQLAALGHFVAGNPANSFFYLITAMHGLHLLGGLVALGRTIAAGWSGTGPDRIGLRVGLCAAYWHFLLLVWLGFFALLLLS